MFGRKYLQTQPTALLALVVGLSGVTSALGRSPESDLTAPGSPLYQRAVDESVVSLLSDKEQAELGAAGRPPSPGPDYYWCENHKTYHLRQDAARGGQPGGVPTPGALPASPGQAPPGGAVPQGAYWCEDCRAYHQGQAPAAGHPAAATPGSAGAPAAASPAASGAAIPDGSGPPAAPREGFYWCEDCKSYHLNPDPANPSAASPNHRAAPPPAGAGQAPGPGYYYCENCKTYHRRAPAEQNPSIDLNQALGDPSETNRINFLKPSGE